MTTATRHPDDEPRLLGWANAGTDRPCPRCRQPIRAGDRVARLDTRPPTYVCESCAR